MAVFASHLYCYKNKQMFSLLYLQNNSDCSADINTLLLTVLITLFIKYTYIVFMF